MAQEAVAVVWYGRPTTEKAFCMCLTVMMSYLAIHEQAVELFSQASTKIILILGLLQVIIERFGRYPHRNDVLGKTSTQKRTEFAAAWFKFLAAFPNE
ncbi:DUF924 domain-containing protein [Vibrio chagasii]|nr:DUF924 domain-containing protein [Vibrio chagasii]